MCGEEGAHALDDWFHFRQLDQVGVFKWICLVIVKFLGAILVAGVSILIAPQRVVPETHGREGGALILGCGFLEIGKAVAIEPGLGRKPAQLRQSGIQIDEVNDTPAARVRLSHAGDADDQRNAG